MRNDGNVFVLLVGGLSYCISRTLGSSTRSSTEARENFRMDYISVEMGLHRHVPTYPAQITPA